MFGSVMAGQGLGKIGLSTFRAGAGSAWRGYSRAAMGRAGLGWQGAVIGGTTGAIYGGLSSDTSILGGALTGMGLGALGTRAGVAGLADYSAARGMGKTFRTASQYGLLAGGREIGRSLSLATNKAGCMISGLGRRGRALFK